MKEEYAVMGNVGLHGHAVTSADTDIKMKGDQSNVKPSFWKKLMCCGYDAEMSEKLIETPEYNRNSKP